MKRKTTDAYKYQWFSFYDLLERLFHISEIGDSFGVIGDSVVAWGATVGAGASDRAVIDKVAARVFVEIEEMIRHFF